MNECKNCLELKEVFEFARHDPHKRLCDTYNFMKELYHQKKLSLYMSDCSFESFLEEVSEEIHYTYHIYLKCHKCKRVYHLGVCIRGTPVYEILEHAPDKADFRCRCYRDSKKFYSE